MKLIQISDCHLFADINKLGYNDINPYLSLLEILLVVRTYKPDLLLITGDLSGDASAASYQHFSQLLAQAELSCPFAVIPGNHDDPDLLVEHFSTEQLWHYSPRIFANSLWQVHLLNSHYQGTLGHVEQDALARLETQLKENPDKFHMVAVHHHPIPCKGWMDKHQWVNRNEFLDLLAQYPSIKAVVYGHIHDDIETDRQGIKYLACPSTCWQWANQQDFGLSELKPGFRVVDLVDDGQIITSVQRLKSI